MRLALFAMIAACGGGRSTPPLTATSVATLSEVHADQIVSQGDVTYALGAQLAIARGDTVTTLVPVDCGTPLCPARVWTSAAAIPALDGEGRWIVATRFDGTLWRVRLDGELEPIGPRFGITRELVRAVGSAGPTVAVLLDRALLVIDDGVHVTRYELDERATSIAVAHDRIALAGPRSVALWNLATATRRTFAIADGVAAFLDADGTAPRLVVRSPRGVWVGRGEALEPLGLAPVAAAVVAGPHLWLERGKRLYVVTDGVAEPAPAATPIETTIATAGDEPMFGTPEGDIWIGDHGPRRYTLDAITGHPGWRTTIQPIFQRVCAHCHLPGGAADIDLSTSLAWTREHDEIVRRVLVTRTMPPAGTVLTDADRATLTSWGRSPLTKLDRPKR
jgi:hypothetical protein